MTPLGLEATRESSHCDRPAADSTFAPTAWRGLLKMVHLCRKVLKLVEHTKTYTHTPSRVVQQLRDRRMSHSGAGVQLCQRCVTDINVMEEHDGWNSFMMLLSIWALPP